MVPATTRRQRHPRCPEASQAPQARVVSTWLLASARFQGITTFPQRVPTVFHQWAHVVLLHRGALARRGAIQRKSFWKVASLKHAQVLRGRLRIRKWGCCADYSPQRCNPPACLAGSRSRSYRCPNFRLCCNPQPLPQRSLRVQRTCDALMPYVVAPLVSYPCQPVLHINVLVNKDAYI